MRYVAIGLVFLVACAGETVTTTTSQITTTTQLVVESTPTSTTVPPTTSTTIDAVLARAAGWLLVSFAVSDLNIGDALSTEDAMNDYVEAVAEVVVMIDNVTTGPIGWGDCAEAAQTLREALLLSSEAVIVGQVAMASNDVDGLNDATTMFDLSTEKTNEARLLGSLFCQAP